MRTQVIGLSMALVVTLGASTDQAAAQLACFTDALVGGSSPEGRIVFVTYSDAADTELPDWADEFATSFADYMSFVSNGQYSLNLQVLRRLDDPTLAWANPNPSTTYRNGCSPNQDHYGTANAWVVEEIYNQYAAAGQPDVWTGVDGLIVIHYKKVFSNAGPVMGVGNLGLGSVEGFDPGLYGFSAGGPTIMMHPSYGLNDSQQILHKEGALAHEYGHAFAFNFGHIPGTWNPGESTCGNPPANPEWVNMGRYSIMDQYNPAPYEGYVSYHPMNLHWLPEQTVAPAPCYQTIRIPDVRDPVNGKKVKVNIPGSSQYFLLVNHQESGHDEKYGGSGLLIWHVWPSFGWDLESAAGKTIRPPWLRGKLDPNTWWDPLEADYCWPGSAADFWDGSRGLDRFNPDTNPNTNLYTTTYQVQDVPSNIHIDNIRYDPGTTDILVDVAIADFGFISPAAGDRFTEGGNAELEWATCADIVDVLVSDETGGNFALVADDIPNSGSFTYAFPEGAAPGEFYRFRIVPDNDNNFSFQSDFVTIWNMENLTVSTQHDCQAGQVGFDFSWETTSPSNGDDVAHVASPSGGASVFESWFSDSTTHGRLLWAACEPGDWTYLAGSTYSESGEPPYSSSILTTGLVNVAACPPCVPVISNVEAFHDSPAGTGEYFEYQYRFFVEWDTDLAASSKVEYRVLGQTEWTETSEDTTPKTHHAVTVENVLPGVTYEYRPLSRVGSDPWGMGPIGTVTTEPAVVTISNFSLSQAIIGTGRSKRPEITFSFDTDVPASCEINIRKHEDPGVEWQAAEFTSGSLHGNNHSHSISSIQPGGTNLVLNTQYDAFLRVFPMESLGGEDTVYPDGCSRTTVTTVFLTFMTPKKNGDVPPVPTVE